LDLDSQGNDTPSGVGSAERLSHHSDTVSPVRRQYLQIKQRFPDTILLFRLGDFYETFEEDAEAAASVLDIVLTGRELGKGVRVPMAGIPHHAADAYIARLVAAGHKVAICDQVGVADRQRGLIDRDVTRVVTPGTVTDPSMLDSHRNTFIAGVIFNGARVGLAYAELSTGEFAATQFAAGSVADVYAAAGREIARIDAAEVVTPGEHRHSAATENLVWLSDNVTTSLTEPWRWRFERAAETLADHFGVLSLDGFGLTDKPVAAQAAGGLLSYLMDTQRSSLRQLTSIRTYNVDGSMELDAQARRTLELTESSTGNRRQSVVAVLDETCTTMGARLLRQWLARPLLDLDEISSRQDAVEHYVVRTVDRAAIRQTLKKVGDIERLANRAVSGSITPRELGSLRHSLNVLRELAAGTSPLPGCQSLGNVLGTCSQLGELLQRALVDDPPLQAGKGEIFRPGFAAQLDEHERQVQEARDWIAGLERHERERSGIRGLKVGYNRVLGYYLEIGASALAAGERSDRTIDLPGDYVTRQTLANATRYVTAQLKEYEARVLGAQETKSQLESDLYRRIVGEVAAQLAPLRTAAGAVAYLDVVSALAEVAAARGYVRPRVDDSLSIEINQGRHPTLERQLPTGQFVPNDAVLDEGDQRITILTGPNMAGKSSWLRQTALIVLLAQTGSFVPAKSARIGLVDRIFTRIGARDDIASGQSTFMVEMTETANLLHHATRRSLVLLDEIGRGTSTWDGLAIARALVEYLHNAPRLGCRTLFATHFLELTALADVLPGVCCSRMDVLEEGERIVFLHRVVPGAADRSYGIHVAELAGVPRALTRRAREILTDLERGPAIESATRRRRAMATPITGEMALQLTLFAPPDPVIATLREIDVESLSPLEALTMLYELKRRVDKAPATEM
jgi:DNA mismatch repair protein MutS